MSERTYTFNDFMTKSQKEKFDIFQNIYRFGDTLKIKDIYNLYEGILQIRKLIKQYSYSKEEPIKLQYVALGYDNYFIDEYFERQDPPCQPQLVSQGLGLDYSGVGGYSQNKFSDSNISNMNYTVIPTKRVKKGKHKHHYAPLPQLLDFAHTDVPIYFFGTDSDYGKGSYFMISGKDNERFN